MKTNKLLAAAALAVAASGVQAQNLVNNGSFEADSQTNWTIYSNLTGWTGGTNGIELRNNVAGAAQDGANFVELDTTKNSSMTQSVTIANDGLYELSFYYSARPNTLAGTNGLDFSFGTLSGSVLNGVGNSGSGNTWQHYTGQVFLTAGTKILTFGASETSDSYGGSLDNISVTAVPEPEAYAMLLAGLGMMGFIANRRRQRQS